jgi:hypothetical protein
LYHVTDDDPALGFHWAMDIEWLVWVPVLFGLGCLIYLIGELFLFAAARLWSFAMRNTRSDPR